MPLRIFSLGHFLARSLRARRSWSAEVVLCAMVALGIVLGGAAILGADAVRRLSHQLTDAPITLYLKENVSLTQARKLADVVKRMPGVVSVDVLTPQKARERLRYSLGSRSALIDGVEESLLPMSIEVGLAPGVAEVLRLHPSFDRLRSAPGVQEIEFGGGLYEELSALTAATDKGCAAVAAVVVLLLGLLLTAHARLAVTDRQAEIAIYRLVGASRSFVELPFLIASALSCLCAAALGLGLLYALYDTACHRLEPRLAPLLVHSPLHFFSLTQMVALLLGAMALGAVACKTAFWQSERAW